MVIDEEIGLDINDAVNLLVKLNFYGYCCWLVSQVVKVGIYGEVEMIFGTA